MLARTILDTAAAALLLVGLCAPLAQAGAAERMSQRDGADQVWIPAGTFVMGVDDPEMVYEHAERPPHEVTISRGFWMDKYEVTCEQYARFLNKYMQKEKRTERHKAIGAALSMVDLDHVLCGVALDTKTLRFAPKSGWARRPVMPVNWRGARQYAVTMGKRLPTEAQWEYAAGGAKGLKYPWGNPWQPTWANVATGKPAPVGSCPKDTSPFGVMDMAGNVREWVLDKFDAKYYSTSPAKDPANNAGAYAHVCRVIRGGGFAFTEWDSRTTSRGNRRYIYFPVATGFRCVESGPAPTTTKAADRN
jgi:formylglycine-generating enzyme required for sulfatase activity